MIELRGIGRWYKSGRTVIQDLRDVGLTVAAGELGSIMAPSGSGKACVQG